MSACSSRSAASLGHFQRNPLCIQNSYQFTTPWFYIVVPATSVAQAGFIFSPCYFLTLIILVPGGQKIFLISKESLPTCQIFPVLFYLIALLSSPKYYISFTFFHRISFPCQFVSFHSLIIIKTIPEGLFSFLS